MKLNSYPKVYNLGHPALRNLFDGPVLVEEKVDGSQFSFGVGTDGVLRFRSRNKEVFDGSAEMFQNGVDAIKELKEPLEPGWVYRGEYLAKPKHNALGYDRTPRGHIILWDIMVGPEDYLGRLEKLTEATRLGLEIVPVIYEGQMAFDLETLDEWLKKESVLGGVLIEGVVIKNRHRFGLDGKMLAGKFVSEAFKEVHSKSYKAANPQSRDIISTLGEAVRTERRWEKTVERLRDAGELEDDPRDIGKLLTAVWKDVEAEEEEEMKARLWKWARKQILRKSTAGMPEWYKRRLAERQAEGGEDAE